MKNKKTFRKPEIISASQLTRDQLEKIYNLFPNLKNKDLDIKIDKDLVGGFIVKQESDIFDASISGKINYLLNKIYENHR